MYAARTTRIRGDYSARVTLRESYFSDSEPIEEQLISFVASQDNPNGLEGVPVSIPTIDHWGTSPADTFETPHQSDTPVKIRELDLTLTGVELAIGPNSTFHPDASSPLRRYIPFVSDPTAPENVLKTVLTARLDCYCEDVRDPLVETAERISLSTHDERG